MKDVSDFFKLEPTFCTALIVSPGGYNENGLSCLGRSEVEKQRVFLLSAGLELGMITAAEGADTKAAQETLQVFLNGNFGLITVANSAYAAFDNFANRFSYLEAFKVGLTFEQVLAGKRGQVFCERWGLPNRLVRAQETWRRIRETCLQNLGKVALICVHGWGYRIEPAVSLAQALHSGQPVCCPDDLPDPKIVMRAGDAVILIVDHQGFMRDYQYVSCPK